MSDADANTTELLAAFAMRVLPFFTSGNRIRIERATIRSELVEPELTAALNAVAPVRSQITLEYDSEANVWFAHSTDVPGLTLESATLTQLGARLDAAVPMLLELNHARLK